MDKNANKIIARPPIVVVMGHIDHGKSTLLDYIRKTKVVDSEAGGITQHISAYEVGIDAGENEKRTITFLDTPGHEAFCKVRERGSKVADIAVLVVSAEDGVKPQTLEALGCIKNDDLPFIIALNKIDKPGSNIDKTKQNLAENEIFVEGWGGTVPVVPISAKNGQGIPDLLEMIILQADLLDLKGETRILAHGFVIESNLDPKKGISASLIIKNGSLKKGQFIATEGAFSPVRNIENFKGESINEASFSSPIRVVGWSNPPIVGSEFTSFKTKKEAEEFASIENFKEQVGKTEENNTKSLNVVIKADTIGSLDAIIYELNKLKNDKIYIRIIGQGVGNITEKDVKTAFAGKSYLIGFNVTSDKNAEVLSLRDGIEIKKFNIIYDLKDWISKRLQEATPVEMIEVITGEAKILKTFSTSKYKHVAGGKVLMGEIKVGDNIKIFRRENEIGEGKMKELQSQKVKTSGVLEGSEFGMMLESKLEIVTGDLIKSVSKVKS